MPHATAEKRRAYDSSERRRFLRNQRRDEINARSRERYKANPEKIKARSRRFHAEHPDYAREAARKFREANRDKIREKALVKLYGITLDEFNVLFDKQGRVCAVCGTDKPMRGGWSVDHSHFTGEVRGILCHICNMGLGCLGDNVEGLMKAINYLRGDALDTNVPPTP